MVGLSSLMALPKSLLRRDVSPVKPASPCMNCGAESALLLNTRVRPDFDTTATLSKDLREAFSDRQDGICFVCGYYQSFKRFDLPQLREINGFGKDITTSEKALHTYPVPGDYVNTFNHRYFSTRLERWGEYFRRTSFRPPSCLFIRSYFGAGADFMNREFGSSISYIDMSDVCFRTIGREYPAFKGLQGSINGHFEGSFLESGPYDAVFVMHILTHSCDIHRTLGQILDLLKPGGVAVFSDEVSRKPTNPFHMLHLSEPQFSALLAKYFGRIDRLDDCEVDPPAVVTRFTAKGDNPDFAAWKD